MQRITITIILLLCLVFQGCKDHQQMLDQLAELERQNQADSLMTNDSLAITLCKYFDSHGTSNERMRAHYMLARTYSDRGEAPQALEEFHTATACADTTAEDCDYRLLGRVCSQAAGLFLGCSLYREMLDALSLQYKYAKQANDTLTWIYAIGSKSEAYYMLGEKDSAIMSLQQANQLYKSYGYDSYAVESYYMLFLLMTEKGRFDEARHYMEIYDTLSGHYKNGLVEEGYEPYYHCKGLFYMGIHQKDSAEIFFRRELRYARSINDQEGAYKGLYLLFKQLGATDSVAKYADLCYQTSEKNTKSKPVEEYQRMHALYNYSHNQKIAQEKMRENARLNHWLFACILLLVMVGVVVVLYIRDVRVKKKEAELNYRYQFEQQERAKRDLIAIHEKEFTFLLDQKEKEIADRQKIIDQLEEDFLRTKSLMIKISKNETHARFRYLSQHPNQKVTSEEWTSLDKMLGKYLPNFKAWVDSRLNIDDVDRRICILTRLQFSPSEIANLIGITTQNLYSRRKQLLKDLFKTTGKPEDFDKKIVKIK